ITPRKTSDAPVHTAQFQFRFIANASPCSTPSTTSNLPARERGEQRYPGWLIPAKRSCPPENRHCNYAMPWHNCKVMIEQRKSEIPLLSVDELIDPPDMNLFLAFASLGDVVGS